MKNLSFAILKNAFYLITLLNFLRIADSLSKEDENNKEDKKSKLFACLKLASIMIQEDKDYLLMAKSAYFQSTKKMKFDEIFETMRDNILLTCFSEISIIKSAELINLNPKAVNPFTKDNKRLLSPETFTARYSDNDLLNREKITKDLDKLKPLFESLLQDMLKFEEKIASFVDSITKHSQKEDSLHKSKSKNFNENANRNKKDNDYDKESEYLDDNEYSNLNLTLFGINLNNPKIKNTLGVVLLVILFLAIYLSYRAVTKKEALPSKKKKKRNEDKEEKEE